MFSSNYVVIIKCHLEMGLTTGPERPDNPIGPGCPRIVSCSEKVNGQKKICKPDINCSRVHKLCYWQLVHFHVPYSVMRTINLSLF